MVCTAIIAIAINLAGGASRAAPRRAAPVPATAQAPVAAPAPAPQPPPVERSTCAAVAVAQADGQGADSAELAALLDSTIRRSQRFLLVDLADAADPGGAQARADKARAAAEALTLARKAYDALDVDAAFEQARRAIYLGAEAPLSQRREALTAALLLAGASRYYAGDEAGAREEFQRLFGIDPSAHLAPADWSPEVLKIAEAERAHAASARRGEATVRSEPVPARVYVDGNYSGISPLLLRGLAPGPHAVTAVAAGYEQRDALLAPGGEQLLSLVPASSGRDLLVLEKDLAATFGSRDGDETLRQIGRDAGSEQVLGARIEQRGHARLAHVIRIQVSDGKRLGEVSGDIALGSAQGLTAADALLRSALGL